MFDDEGERVDVVRPLNVRGKTGQDKEMGAGSLSLSARRRKDEMKEINVGRDVEIDSVNSPVWVPRLTPTRKGDDLFISVGWGGRM